MIRRERKRKSESKKEREREREPARERESRRAKYNQILPPYVSWLASYGMHNGLTEEKYRKVVTANIT